MFPISRGIRSWNQSLWNIDQNPATCSQERNQDNPRQGGCWKQQRGDVQFCVWERYMIIQKRMKSGKARSENSDNPTNTQSCVELIENHLTSSGMFHQDSHLLSFFKRSRKIRKLDRKILNNLREYFCSCRCSMTLIAQRMDISWTVFRIPKKWESTRKDFSEDIGHSTVLEMNKNGLERTLMNQK